MVRYKNYIIIERDQELMDYWAEISMNNKDIGYSEIWELLDSDDQKEIDKRVQKKFQTAIKNRENIVINMTNMSKKSRRKWLSDHVIKNQYYKTAVVFIETIECLQARNYADPEKNISVEIIQGFMSRFVYPLLDEFDNVIA